MTASRERFEKLDLINRLRKYKAEKSGWKLTNEAADEIERLQAALADAARPAGDRHPLVEADKLAYETCNLIDRFAEELKHKLAKAEEKYGYGIGWMQNNWQADLTVRLHEHIAKGDPRDVAAYCAFAWHHGWSLRAAPASQAGDAELMAVINYCRNAFAANPNRLSQSHCSDGDMLALIRASQRERSEP